MTPTNDFLDAVPFLLLSLLMLGFAIAWIIFPFVVMRKLGQIDRGLDRQTLLLQRIADALTKSRVEFDGSGT